MLVQVSNISPGDEISTARGGGKVKAVEVLEDGSVRLEYFEGPQEWLESGQIVVKKDKFSLFFTPNPVQ